jgi:UDPglucose 6-dehydrogenase
VKITVLGAGYVGLVSGACLAHVGHEVVCVDADPERVAKIRAGEAPFREPGLAELMRPLLARKRLRVTTDLAREVRTSRVSMIAVGTPFDGERIDLTQARTAARQIGHAIAGMSDFHTVVVKSTVVPSTTDTVVRAELEGASGRKVGSDLGLCMNPEFLQEGSAVRGFLEPDRIVIGRWDDRSGHALAEVYRSFGCTKLLTTLRDAELIKYASNSLLATLVSFSNEIASLCETLPGTDCEVVMNGLHLDRRLSPRVDGRTVQPGLLSYLRAGSGFGGSCLPKDVNALRAFASDLGCPTPILDAVMAVNQARPAALAAAAGRALGGLEGRRIAVLGLAFKPETDDLRDSPALTLIDALHHGGAHVRVFDPVAMPAANGMLEDRASLAASIEVALTGADAALIATAWRQFVELDWREALPLMRQAIIVDGRNALRAASLPPYATYIRIGRVGSG